MMISALNFFVHLQVMVAIGGALALLLRRLSRSGILSLNHRAELRLHYLLLGLLAISLWLPMRGEHELSNQPFARVMSEGKMAAGEFHPSAQSRLMVGPVTKASSGVALEACGALVLMLLLAGALLVLRDYLCLRRVLGRAVIFRRIGRVRLAVIDEPVSPFSALTISPLGARTAWVVLPARLLSHSKQASLSIAHELQHHRAGDTIFCHLFGAPLRALCFFHPMRALWSSVVAEIQELACDEALVSQKTISVRDYSECLVSAAETAVRDKAGRAYAAAPSLFSNRRLLLRRIENMYQTKQNKKWVVYALGLTLGCCLAASAGATGNWVSDSRIRMDEAEKLAEDSRRTSDFPVAVNEKVLKYLNYYLGTAKGREKMKSALANLEALRPRLEEKRAKYHAPRELIAVGLIESGFQNLPSSENQVSGAAGIWQFIASTARVFGMRVNNQVDERLDIDMETDAAFRYLVANKLRFNDWLLGVMAYNIGERNLENAIVKLGTRDAWELIKRGIETDNDYLPKFMAAVLILKNPQMLK